VRPVASVEETAGVEVRIASVVAIFHAAVEAIETHSAADPVVPKVITAVAPEPVAAVAHPAWDPGVAVDLEAAAAVEGAAGSAVISKHRNFEGDDMNLKIAANLRSRIRPILIATGFAFLFVPAVVRGQEPKTNVSEIPAATTHHTFDTPQSAADALIAAAGKFDVGTLASIFGPGGEDIVFSGEYPQDKQRALDFAAEAKEKTNVTIDPKTGNRAFLLVGSEDWPFPVPIVKQGDRWSFDANAGRQELLYRRIGSNELDAIDICHGFVEAQYDFAFRKRKEYEVNQYAQRIISTPGKQDGLAWQNEEGTWGGPIGEKIARAIEQGYSTGADPYHGYFFKILKGQGPAAPMGQMDYVVKGVMIGGFALVAAPAEYGVTGVKAFIVSQDGVVYEKDFGPSTLNEFAKMERFNPDKSWEPAPQDEE